MYLIKSTFLNKHTLQENKVNKKIKKMLTKEENKISFMSRKIIINIISFKHKIK